MSGKNYIVSLDIGTTHVKALLSNLKADVIDITTEDYKTLYPGPEMVEQNPDEVLYAVVKSIKSLINKNNIRKDDKVNFVFAGILHSFLPIDKNGNKLNNALIWADTRSVKESDYLRGILDIEDVRYRTGCSIHPLYYLPKLLWFKKNASDIFKKTWKFISIKEYIIFKLFGQLLVDRSIASGTCIWNMHTLNWDENLLNTIGISSKYFSQVVGTTTNLKKLKNEYLEIFNIKDTSAIIGSSDGPLAHLGSAGISNKSISLTIGTGAAVRSLVNNPTFIPSKEVWCYYMAENKWLIGGVVHDAGMALKWLIDNIIDNKLSQSKNPFVRIDRIVEQIRPGSENLLFLPFIGGERSPHYNPSIRGVIFGLSYIHFKGHIARSLMEGISYRLYTVYKMIKNYKEGKIIITGGILKSPNWLQITSDFFGENFFIPKIKEASAYGGVLLELKALDIIKDFKRVNDFVKYQKELKCNLKIHRKYTEITKRYNELYQNLYGSK